MNKTSPPEETEFSDDGIPDDMPTNEGEPLTKEQIDNDSVNPTSITRVKLKKA